MPLNTTSVTVFYDIVKTTEGNIIKQLKLSFIRLGHHGFNFVYGLQALDDELNTAKQKTTKFFTANINSNNEINTDMILAQMCCFFNVNKVTVYNDTFMCPYLEE